MKNKILELRNRPDKDFAEILRHAFWALVMLGGTTVLQFVFDLILTNRFGAHGAGTFYLAFSVMMVLALLGRLGLDQAVVRFMTPLLSTDPGKASGVRKSAVALSLMLTLPLSVGLLLSAPWLANDVFRSPELQMYLRIFAFGIPAFSLAYIFSASLKAMKRTRLALSVERAGIYFFGIIALLSAGLLYGFDGLVIGFVAGIIITAAIGAYQVHRNMPTFTHVKPFDKKLLLLTALPLLFVAFATQMNGQASMLLLGAFGSNAEVGIFNVALKVSMLMNLILAAINVITATKISEQHALGLSSDLEKTIQKTSGLGAALGIPLFITISLLAPFLLGLFGSEFVTGATTLIILSAGQLINVSVGSTNYVLAMTGHQKALALAVGTALISNILLGLWLIPAYGVLGAGITTSLTLGITNLLTVLLVKKYTGTWSLPFVALWRWTRLIR